MVMLAIWVCACVGAVLVRVGPWVVTVRVLFVSCDGRIGLSNEQYEKSADADDGTHISILKREQSSNELSVVRRLDIG